MAMSPAIVSLSCDRTRDPHPTALDGSHFTAGCDGDDDCPATTNWLSPQPAAAAPSLSSFNHLSAERQTAQQKWGKTGTINGPCSSAAMKQAVHTHVRQVLWRRSYVSASLHCRWSKEQDNSLPSLVMLSYFFCCNSLTPFDWTSSQRFTPPT